MNMPKFSAIYINFSLSLNKFCSKVLKFLVIYFTKANFARGFSLLC